MLDTGWSRIDPNLLGMHPQENIWKLNLNPAFFLGERNFLVLFVSSYFIFYSLSFQKGQFLCFCGNFFFQVSPPLSSATFFLQYLPIDVTENRAERP